MKHEHQPSHGRGWRPTTSGSDWKEKSEFMKSKCAHINLDGPFHHVNRISSEANKNAARFVERCKYIVNENSIHETIKLVRVKSQGATKLSSYNSYESDNDSAFDTYKQSITKVKSLRGCDPCLITSELRLAGGATHLPGTCVSVWRDSGANWETRTIKDCPLSACCRAKSSLLNTLISINFSMRICICVTCNFVYQVFHIYK